MPRVQLIIPFLRPLGAPRRAACQQLFRFSTATRLRIEQPAESGSKTTRTPETTPSTTSKPSPEAPSPARAADLAAAEAATDADSAQAPATHRVLPSQRPKALKANAPTPSQLQLPPPKYHVARSKSNQMPVYTDYKRGGNLHVTIIRKITGDVAALRDELKVLLDKDDEHVKINNLTQHVVVKGHHQMSIIKFLEARGM